MEQLLGFWIVLLMWGWLIWIISVEALTENKFIDDLEFRKSKTSKQLESVNVFLFKFRGYDVVAAK